MYRPTTSGTNVQSGKILRLSRHGVQAAGESFICTTTNNISAAEIIVCSFATTFDGLAGELRR